MKYLIKHAILLSMLAALSLSGCGGDEGNTAVEGDAEKEAGSTPSPEKSEADLGDPVKEIVIEANDKMKYNIESFTVPAGKPVKLTIDNVGTMPELSMGHNVVILTQEADPLEFVQKAMTKAANDYIPPSQTDQVVAHTEMTGGGETDTIIFRTPEEKGEYEFLCSFPGHYQAGMKGTMVVE